MIKATTFKDRTVAVFGLGRTGISAALSLQEGGANVWAWDDRDVTRDAADAQGVTLHDLSKADWSKIDELVLSPGVPDNLPEPHWSAVAAKAAGVPIICDIEILAREINARPDGERPKVVAITGTNGKSTTTALIGHVLRALGRDAQVGGNIGRGVLDLDRMQASSTFVLELSSYQLERTHSLRVNAAVLLNLSPDHLERHGTMDLYAAAKHRIFANQTSDDTVIIGVDDEHGRDLTTQLKVRNGRKIIPISAGRVLGHGVSVLGSTLSDRTGKRSKTICDLSQAKALTGRHNAQNAAAAYAAVASFGYEPSAIGEALLTFPGLAHRMEFVGKAGRVQFVNDSKATNAEAARQSLGSYNNIYWIAGGQAKDGGIKPLMDMKDRVTKAYLIGEAARDFAKTLKDEGVSCKLSGELRMAILCAMRDALESGTSDPVILLAPACASWDQFSSFEHRGDVFRKEAGALMKLFEREMSSAQEEALSS